MCAGIVSCWSGAEEVTGFEEVSRFVAGKAGCASSPILEAKDIARRGRCKVEYAVATFD